MSTNTSNKLASKKVTSIPLNKLKRSPHNVRKMPHSKSDIEALAASILANGLLQNLIVEPECNEKGRETGNFLVTAGEGRRRAHLLLVKRKKIMKSHHVRCIIEKDGNNHEISLAENIIRTAMHPADQYEAFAKLHEQDGMSAEDSAVRFGVSTHNVMQRLKLGAVSPQLRNLYRAGDMTLEQFTAFTITSDHARQERVWAELPAFSRGRHSILRALSEGQVPSTDARALFIGPKAYAAAGGTVIRDLFEEDGGYFADAELLNRLAMEKLSVEAEAIRAEGWKWLEIVAELDFETTSQMRRTFPQAPKLSKVDQDNFDELEHQHDCITEACGGDPSPEEETALANIAAELEAIGGPPTFEVDQLAQAGAFVTLHHDGT